jgi:hypothetical protein
MTAIARSNSHHGARIVYGEVAFELLCDGGLEHPVPEANSLKPRASVLCSVSADLPAGAGRADPSCRWDGDRAMIRAPGVVASLRHLAPRRYAVTAHVTAGCGLEPLLAAVAHAIGRRDRLHDPKRSAL